MVIVFLDYDTKSLNLNNFQIKFQFKSELFSLILWIVQLYPNI